MLFRLSSVMILAFLVLTACKSNELEVHNPYARAISENAKSGAAYFVVNNGTDADVHLVSVISDIAKKVELHDHIMNGDIAEMVHVEEGFIIPAGEDVSLKRRGKHVMLMGLNKPLTQGDQFELTLQFKKAPAQTIVVTVDNEK